MTAGLTTYTYDGQDQLKSETSSRGAALGAISYDAAGNGSLGGGGNADNQAGYTSYDGNGNPAATQGGASLAFDAANKATLVGGNQVLSSYGPDGLRTQKTGSTGARFFNYDGLAPVVETGSGSGILAVNTFGPAGLISRNSGGVSTFYTPDERGNVAQRLDTSGAVKSSDLYNAYGKRLSGGGASGDPYGFGGQAGYYTDGETGLSLLGQRFYDPSVSRFLNRDPIGSAGGLNLYRYADNNPVNFMDPLGLDPGYWDGFWSGYLGHSGSFGKGIGRGFANFGAGMVLQQPGSLLPQSVQDWQPYGAACNEDVADGQQFGYDLAFVGSFFTGAGEEAEATRLLKGPCFIAGTPVQMKDGDSKPIEDVEAGDLVQSRNEKTGQSEVKIVERTYVEHVKRVVTASFADASTGKVVQTVTCTPQHPFYVAGKGFVAAELLPIGASVVTRSGSPLLVCTVKLKDDAKGHTVYNFEVQDDHTYFVGTASGGAWVHNDCVADAKAALKALIRKGEDGKIVHLAPSRGAGGVPIGGVNYPFHDFVQTSEGKIIDKMSNGHTKPVPFEEWEQNFNKKLGWDYRGNYDIRSGSGNRLY